MVNPELDAGESDFRDDDHVRGHMANPSGEYPSGKIRIEELLDTLSCIQCNAGLVVGVFAGLMMMIRHKESGIQMSRVPSQTTLDLMLSEGGLSFIAGFSFMGSLGLFRKLWSERIDFLRKPCLIAATILTISSLAVHVLSTFWIPGSEPEDQMAAASRYTMCLVIMAFDLLVVGIALKVMIYNSFGYGYNDNASPRFMTPGHQNEFMIPGQ